MTEIAGTSCPGSTPQAESPVVSAVVVNWNGAQHLDGCLSSLCAQRFAGRLHVILIDNGSSDDSIAVARRYSPRVEILYNSSNRGFAGGANQGIVHRESDYVALLNNDAVVRPDWLTELLRAMAKAPDIGSCTSKVMCYDDPEVFDNAGHVLFADGLTRGRGRLEQDRGQYNGEEEVFSASGCAVLLRRKMLEDIGLFDETFFAYCEDADLGFRARLRGWRCLYVPTAVAYHKFSASSDAFSALKALNVERNRLWLAVKNLPWWPFLCASPFFTASRYFWQAWGAVAGRGASGRFVQKNSARQLLGLLLRAYLEAFRGLPHAWRLRRIIQAHRTVPLAEVARWLRVYGVGARKIALME